MSPLRSRLGLGVGLCRGLAGGGGHGMSGWRAPEMQHWKPEMVAWLNKTMK